MRRKGFHRYLTVAVAFPLREPDADRYRPCRVCGGRCATRRHRTCSAKCYDAVARVSSITHQRWAVEHRDHGVCSKCGFDTKPLASVLWHVRLHGKFHIRLVGDVERWARKALGFNPSGALWEMDHIVPVFDGGGVFPGITADEILQNLRTLCVPCHKERRRPVELKG